MAGIIAFVASSLLVAAPAQGSRFSLVEARPAATPYLRLTGGQMVSRTLGIWRVPERDARRLRRGGPLCAPPPPRGPRFRAGADAPPLRRAGGGPSVGAAGG